MAVSEQGAHLSALRRAVTDAYRRDEAECVQTLCGQLTYSPVDEQQIANRARALVDAVRQKRLGASGVDNLMRQFSLSSQEGVALMCLAEALYRIPDAETADRLIRDKIAKGDWRAHIGQSSSLFVNAAAWGLMITGKLVATTSEQGLASALTRLIAKGGEPLIRKGVDLAIWLLGRQFVMGETIEQALERARPQEARGYRYSYDMLGEAALTATDAERYCASYAEAIRAIAAASKGRGVYLGPGISVKLSALHPRYARAQRERVLTELLPRLTQLALLAKQHAMGFNIDAEEADRLDLSLDLLQSLAFDRDLADWNGLGFVVQAYQKRSPFVIDYLAALARASGHRFMVRLVKGAYWDSEIKRAQIDGLEGYPVYTRKTYTDLSYLVCAGKLLEAGDALYPQFATHNAYTLSAVLQMALGAGVEDYEFQCLHGMGEPLYDEVVGADRRSRPCRIYAPVGSHETLLPYLVRRLLENGANSSFVHRVVDERVSVEELVVNPLQQAMRERGSPHPQIPLPQNLFTGRVNSTGIDLSNESVIDSLGADLDQLQTRSWRAAPLLSVPTISGASSHPIINPARFDDLVGTASEATASDVESALAAAHALAPQWQAVPVATRAQILDRAADLYQQNRAALVSLCIREAGKTWASGIAEVREAVDYCRYYAQQARLHGGAAGALGPVVCISPWNFPLAIFTGQIAATLAAGNPVIAKPAEQTPLIAAFAAQLMRDAGVPPAALQCLPGAGATVGAALVADSRVRGVLFTGSTEVAQAINGVLVARSQHGAEVVLIAETGGQNAMLVDSSALLEQVVQDVLASAFDSAGQRCSALRVLCVQREIADRLLDMLRGAMRELRIGNPALLATDVGPVIDKEAQAALEAHIERMRAAGSRVYRFTLPDECANGKFVAPALIEIESIAELKREVFGPILHLLRYDSAGLPRLIDEINATGYGLTLGLHTRIDETIDQVSARAKVGNIYVNRNMIGAVVGVQPFGGEGKSGTGPKAGGPLYLQRLLAGAELDLAALGFERAFGTTDRLQPLQGLAAWAKANGRQTLAELCAEYARTTPRIFQLRLPGPTGETNRLAFAARGTVLCMAPNEAALLAQLAAALATGNDVLLTTSLPLLAQLPSALTRRIRVQPLTDATFDAALFFGNAEDLQRLRRQIAERPGSIIPVLTPQPEQSMRYPLHRLVVERVMTINTAAAGGNATLMTLAE